MGGVVTTPAPAAGQRLPEPAGLDGFHSAVAEWFRRRFPDGPTESQALGWLVSFIVKPDPTRLAPSPPFDAESARFAQLVDALTARLHQN